MMSASNNAEPPSGAPDLLSDPIQAESSVPYVSMELEDGRLGRLPDQMRPPGVGEDDENQSLSSKSFTSVLTATGIHDVSGFFVVCFVILIGDMARGVMFPTLWPLVESLGGNTVTLGYAVAAFSFGRILVSPLFGSWSTTMGYTKTLLISTSILVVGTLLYAQVQNIGKTQVLILAQTILGVGSGTLGVTRAFVADVTAKRERTTYMAFVTAVQYGGFTVTPFFGALFTSILGDNDFRYGIFRLNMYTAPAYFMTIMVLITIVLLKTLFKDRERIIRPKPPAKKSKRRNAIDNLANTTTAIGLTTYDACILGCMLLNIATKGSIASFETLGINYAETYFDIYSARAGAIVASCGSLGVIVLLCMGWMEKWFSDFQLICGGVAVMAGGIFSLTNVKENSAHDWRYILAMFLIYSIGYPVGHTAVIGMFSKIVGRRPQGTLMGWFASAGSFARITFPIMSGYVANYASPVTLFYILTGILGTAVIFVLINRHTLSMLST